MDLNFYIMALAFSAAALAGSLACWVSCQREHARRRESAKRSERALEKVLETFQKVIDADRVRSHRDGS